MEDSLVSWGILLCIALIIGYFMIKKSAEGKTYTESTYVSKIYDVDSWGRK